MEKIKVALFAIGLVIANLSYGQISTPNPTGQDSTSSRIVFSAVPFLTISPESRGGAMGETGAATSGDAYSAHWNPAKLVFAKSDLALAFSYSPWLRKLDKDLNLAYLTFFKKISREQAIGASFRYFDWGEIYLKDQQGGDMGTAYPNEFALDGTYSRMLNDNFSIGLSGRFIYSNLGQATFSDNKPGKSVAADVGIYYNTDLMAGRNNSNLAVAAVMTNIGSKISYNSPDQKDPIPTNLRLGTAYTTSLDPYNTFTIAADFNKLMVPTPHAGYDPSKTSLLKGMFGSFSDAPDGFKEELSEITVSTGAEYWYNETFAARAGFFYEDEEKGNRKYLTFGLGLRYQLFGIDFAYLVPFEQEHPMGEAMRFSLVLNFEDYKVRGSVKE